MKDIARYFLYLGSTGFGGPLVLIQQMRQQYVEEKKMISGVQFDQAFALVKAMPGPVAFQMAVFLGGRFAGFWGGLTAGVCLLLPAFIMMVLAGIFYSSIVSNVYLDTFLQGILFSASAVIVMSLKSLIQPNRSSWLFWIFLAVNLILFWFNLLPEPVLIILFGLLAVLIKRYSSSALLSATFFMFDWEAIYKLTKTCLYAGAVVFGTGYALLPVLKSNLVDLDALITLKQFNDGVIFGQMTPGPITITASFLGYEISGLAGAVMAIAGISFFPFFHISTWFPKAMDWMSRQKWVAWFVMGATSAVVAGILITVVHMNESSKQIPAFWVLFLGSLIWLYRKPKTPVLLLFMISGLAYVASSLVF
ncbi:MAG: putative chromate transport protein [Pseudobdellovibrio sp.]|jgi:chromate transporter|nr:putative chromate transport protein [Pseudobdellovibrio sp.]